MIDPSPPEGGTNLIDVLFLKAMVVRGFGSGGEGGRRSRSGRQCRESGPRIRSVVKSFTKGRMALGDPPND